jgi:type IV pilus assembly protein PilY1
MIRDPNVGNVTTYGAPITEEDLADLTTNLTPTRDELFGGPANPLLGWLIKMTDPDTSDFIGEKVLAEPLIFNNVINFTTFVPPTTAVGADCLPNLGTGKVYAVSLFDGSPVLDLDSTNGGTLGRKDRSLNLLRSGIPPNVVILFSKLNGVVPVAFVAAEKLDMEFSDAPVKTYWFQQEVR